jgi:hypothetical protein
MRYRAYRGGGTTTYRARLLTTAGIVASARRWRARAADVEVLASRGESALVAATLPGSGVAVEEVIVGDGPRRRVAVVLARRRRRTAIVKLAAGDPDDRAAAEQETLQRLAHLGMAGVVPRPLGYGVLDGHEWSAETWSAGVTLRSASRRWWTRHGATVLDGLADWLTDLAVRSSGPSTRAPEVRLPLRGRPQIDLARLAAEQANLNGVLTHGDLASGENVLVRRDTFAVIDWETALPDGLPMTDLVPTLALGRSLLDRTTSGPDQAERVVALCRGEGVGGEWLFQSIARYADRVGVATESVGALATLAWGYQASLRARHEELVRASGREPANWTSVGELVYERWTNDSQLGVAWPAFAGWRRSA